jgi:hypothetical protein
VWSGENVIGDEIQIETANEVENDGGSLFTYTKGYSIT